MMHIFVLLLKQASVRRQIWTPRWEACDSIFDGQLQNGSLGDTIDNYAPYGHGDFRTGPILFYYVVDETVWWIPQDVVMIPNEIIFRDLWSIQKRGQFIHHRSTSGWQINHWQTTTLDTGWIR